MTDKYQKIQVQKNQLHIPDLKNYDEIGIPYIGNTLHTDAVFCYI